MIRQVGYQRSGNPVIKTIKNLDVHMSNMLGKGGFGTVYKGTLNQNGKQIDVAVKELKKYMNNQTENQYYNEEVQTSIKIMNLQNQHIVQILGVFSQPEDDNTTYVAMDLCIFDLCKLKKEKNGGRLETLYVLKKMKEVAIGIKALHDQGYVHRDIKPDNIFITQNPDGELIFKVGDFGLGKQKEVFQSKVGTVCYMAPDMLTYDNNEYTKSVDIWALGVMTHELITGAILFHGNTIQIIRDKILASKPYRTQYEEFKSKILQYPDFISQSFQYIQHICIVDLIEKLLNKDPKTRIDINQVIEQFDLTIQKFEEFSNQFRNQVNYQQGQQQYQMNGQFQGQNNYNNNMIQNPQNFNNHNNQHQNLQNMVNVNQQNNYQMNNNDENNKQRKELEDLKSKQEKMQNEKDVQQQLLVDKSNKLQEYKKQIDNKDDEIRKKDIVIKNKDNEIEKKNDEIKKKDTEIINKDNEIYRLKQQLAEFEKKEIENKTQIKQLDSQNFYIKYLTNISQLYSKKL